ncbi:hypothetical protein B0T24DRAFT_654712 [Lasiosphaeria ovina]|uniref:Uncharacterized protein n=1 Tax=Lasiosphaeria ovina TaxID=92902 RepID=A0AAE0NN36_9PEZI|nr:hypothetical protein B0T24DRAFT_654712 [Lasiosphaeria ovina]
MNHNVSLLMIPTFSGNEKDATLRTLIADDKATLSALALVNSDCRQLARSCQFADVCFDYSPNSRLLLLQLLKEAITRLGDDDPSCITQPPFIGSCIRRATVRPRPEWVAHAHGDLYDAIWGDAANPIVTLRNTALLSGTAINLAMPHLETLLWHDRLCLDGALFTAIANLPLRHLKLAGVHIGEAHRLEPPVTPLIVPLESLSLGIHLCNNAESHKGKIIADADADADVNAWENRSLSPLITTILQHRSLSSGREHITFNRLRYLDISGIVCNPDVQVWSSLFSAPLRHLSLPSTILPAFKQALSACEPLRDLETLVVPYLDGKDVTTVQPMIDLISCHPHLHTLSIGNTSPQLMDSHLIPLLSDGRWSNLASLSLVWSELSTEAGTQPHTAIIPADSLAAIGSIGSLEQISLSAGCQFGWRHQWLIDHDTVRFSLQRLAKLKRLAFSRDTYRVLDGGLGLDVERYYEQRHVTSAEDNDALERPELDRVRDVEYAAEGEDNSDGLEIGSLGVWERAHRNRMLREGGKYAAAFPCLEWMYCGQWPMEVRRVGALGGTVRAVPLGKERDSCWTLLRRMFAMMEDDDRVLIRTIPSTFLR